MLLIRFEKFNRRPASSLVSPGKPKAHVVPDAASAELQYFVRPSLFALSISFAPARSTRSRSGDGGQSSRPAGLDHSGALLKPHVRRPDDARLAVDQPARQFSKPRADKLVGEMEMPAPYLSRNT